MAVYVHDGFSVYIQGGYEGGCCEVIVVRICSSSHHFNVFGVYYRNPSPSDNFFDCLLTTVAKVQFGNRKTSFLFVGYVNARLRSGLSLLRRICTVEQRVTLPYHRVVSRWLRSLHKLMEECLTWC